MIPNDYFVFKPIIKDEDIPFHFVVGPRGYGLAKRKRVCPYDGHKASYELLEAVIKELKQ